MTDTIRLIAKSDWTTVMATFNCLNLVPVLVFIFSLFLRSIFNNRNWPEIEIDTVNMKVRLAQADVVALLYKS